MNLTSTQIELIFGVVVAILFGLLFKAISDEHKKEIAAKDVEIERLNGIIRINNADIESRKGKA